MPDTTYAKQVTSQLDFYNANAPRTKDGKKKIADQTDPLVKILGEFDKLAGQASGLTGDKLKSAQAQAGDLLQQVMNQFGLLCEAVNTLHQSDLDNPAKGSGALATGTVSEKQAQANHDFDNGYLDKVSLILMTFQANVTALQGLDDSPAD